MTAVDFGTSLRLGLRGDPGALADVMASAAASIGATDAVVYLVDFEQQVLEPLPNLEPHREVPEPEDTHTTMAGRAFTEQRPVIAERAEGVRVWVPVAEGSDRTGVLALTVPEVDGEVLLSCEDLGLMAGCMIATQTRFTDVYAIHRRRKAMSLAATMQWDLLPPLVLRSGRATVAGRVEPAYHVGGDCFDYALNGSLLDLATFDAMGHGVQSALSCSLAVSAYRHDRREGRLLGDMHTNVEEHLATAYGGHSFVTGQLARLDVESGVLSWTNAGHPRPLLVRGGRVVGQLQCVPSVPWGLAESRSAPTVATEPLQPNDRVIFYTDGVIEARRIDGGFGIERLSDLVGQHCSDQVRADESVRHIVRAVLEHHEGRLDDDATVMIVDWHPN